MDLQAPTRVAYVYGKVLGVNDFQDEQDYHRGKHERLRRFGIGSGVVSGLEISTSDDGQVVVGPGLAIDGYGREIVVPTATVVADPFQLTDDDGQPVGPAGGDGLVTLCLAYAEEEVGGVPALPDAPNPDDTRMSRIAESYRIVVWDGPPPPDPGLVVLGSVTRSSSGQGPVDAGGGRQTIHSNAQLLVLIMSLADRLATLERELAAARRPTAS